MSTSSCTRLTSRSQNSSSGRATLPLASQKMRSSSGCGGCQPLVSGMASTSTCPRNHTTRQTRLWYRQRTCLPPHPPLRLRVAHVRLLLDVVASVLDASVRTCWGFRCRTCFADRFPVGFSGTEIPRFCVCLNNTLCAVAMPLATVKHVCL